MRIVDLVAVLVALLSAMAMVFGAYFTLDDLHASKEKVLGVEIDLRQEIIHRDIKKDAEARAHYKDIAQDRSLEPAEESRLEYLEEQLERKYEEQRMLEQKAMELK